LTGTDNGCPNVYDNVGFDLMYGLAFERVHMSLHGSVFLNSFDPVSMSVALGVAGKAHLSDRVAVVFDPKIAIAATERDTINDDALYIPVELEFQVGAPTMLKLLTGLLGGLSAFGDTFQVPLGIGVVQNLSPHFDLGARFSFDNLLGHQPQGVSAADTRSLAILLNIRS
jgi:hypothetical protein